MLPDCNGTHLTLDSPYSNQGQLAGYIYLSIGCISMPICSFVFYVFSRPNVKQSSCYKLLMITTSLDILNLISATIVSGFASIFGVSYCDNGFKWLYPYGHFFMCVWYIYCASTEVLALNRMLVFARPQLAIFLFKGRRVWLWLIPIFAYSAFGLLIDPSMYFVYLPNRGFFLDGKTSVFHIFNNFFKLGFVTACYIIMTLFIIKLKRKNTNKRGSRISSHQITLSLQTLGVAALADFTSCGYLGANYFPDHWAISQYSGNIGQLEWIFLHSGTGIIYLLVNKSVRTKFLSLFCWSKSVKMAQMNHMIPQNHSGTSKSMNQRF